MRNFVFLIVLIILTSVNVSAQVYTNKVVGEKNAEYVDSLKSTEYPYSLPIWGDKATAAGYDLPYSAGLGINYLWQESALVIEDLLVGFNYGPMYDISEIVRIEDATARASGVSIRPDVWLLPFLNVYGLFTKARTSTEITAGLWLPDADNVWSEVTAFKSKAEFEATGVGFGLTPTMGVAGGWIALDMNVTWQSVSALDKPVMTFVFGPRMGKSFKLKKPESNVTLWVGGFRLHLQSETNGSLPLNEVIPTDGLQAKVDEGMENVADKQIAVDEWWAGLSPIEQANPVNQAKYETANRALDAAGNLLVGLDGALNDDQTATVQYSLNKRPKDMWNFVVGSQYQINKHFMLRAEAGFLGSRTQFIGMLQYRFGL
ncbi:MAG: hypothetical protein MUC78_10830 [Bacteroidales bacterium]|jgi:hypothetical protein|nr:hypothetical protein [Bacteroidales bacterium]